MRMIVMIYPFEVVS